MEQTKEDKLDEIKNCINQEDSLYYIHEKDATAIAKKAKELDVPLEYVIRRDAIYAGNNVLLKKK